MTIANKQLPTRPILNEPVLPLNKKKQTNYIKPKKNNIDLSDVPPPIPQSNVEKFSLQGEKASNWTHIDRKSLEVEAIRQNSLGAKRWILFFFIFFVCTFLILSFNLHIRNLVQNQNKKLELVETSFEIQKKNGAFMSKSLESNSIEINSLKKSLQELSLQNNKLKEDISSLSKENDLLKNQLKSKNKVKKIK